MYDWNNNGQIDPMDQFIYMVFREVMGNGSDDDSDDEDDDD